MNFNQSKLTKSEWESTEQRISQQEHDILSMIIAGYHNPAISSNAGQSLIDYLKITSNQPQAMDDYLYDKYFNTRITDILKTNTTYEEYKNKHSEQSNKKLIRLNSADTIRMANIDQSKIAYNTAIFENLLLQHADALIGSLVTNGYVGIAQNYYTLLHLMKASVPRINAGVTKLIDNLIKYTKEQCDNAILVKHIIEFAFDIIERNPTLLANADSTLYSHQRDIFAIFRRTTTERTAETVQREQTPKLVLYIAPTGTGKTMTPLALAEDYRIIFVCAARHVGLALSRAAIAMGRKVAFAFGCKTADDIRLHNAAAVDYIPNKRSGGIGKINNAVGTAVEIMICDVQSYIVAMTYMISFNAPEKLIMYWDEPTITLDYSDHALHELIQTNWSKNRVPNVVLSSATLPHLQEMAPVVRDFMDKFPGALVREVQSFDCKKSIPLVDTMGRIVLPHHHKDATAIVAMARHIDSNPTLLRYLDLGGVCDFICHLMDHYRGAIRTPDLFIENTEYFDELHKVTMNSIKQYYLKLVQAVDDAVWPTLIAHFAINRAEAPSGVNITTKDAYTLTDGPTIYITADPQKIAQFCIQQAGIPDKVMSDLRVNIETNNVILKRVEALRSEIEAITDKTVFVMSGNSKDCHKINREHVQAEGGGDTGDRKDKEGGGGGSSDIKRVQLLTDQLTAVCRTMKKIVLNDLFIPNKLEHLNKWAPTLGGNNYAVPFTSNIDDVVMERILKISGVKDYWKVLLLMGIGVFMSVDSSDYNIEYMEIMKSLATDQKLYLIIASSDYIYGTNYQLCHGYLGKDLTDGMTQEKIIQALGRIGRNNVQHTYSVRFRDDTLINRLFMPIVDGCEKPEVANMCRLFCTLAEDDVSDTDSTEGSFM